MLSLPLITIIVLAMSLLVLEFKFKSGKRRLARVLATLVALASIFLLLKPPVYNAAPSKASVIFRNRANLSVPDSIDDRKYVTVSSLKGLSDISDSLVVKSLLIVGEGLETRELKKIRTPFSYLPNKLPAGLTSFHIPGRIYAGQSFEVEGSALHFEKSELWIGFEGKAQAKIMMDSGNNTFNTEIIIPAAGHHQLIVTSLNNSDTLFSEIYPVRVLESKKPSVLVWSDQPSFEQRYLINYLEKFGYRVAIRQQLSREIKNSRFVNMKPLNLDNVNQKLIENFDLLITGAEELNAMSQAELATIQQYTGAGSLGLFLLSGSTEVQKSSFATVTKDDGLWQVETDEGQLNIELQQMEFEGSVSNEIVYDGRDIGTYSNSGSGTIGISFLKNTYRLKLKGSEKLYEEIWRALLLPVLGKRDELSFFDYDPLAASGQPMEISFFEERFDPPEIFIDSVRWPVRESIFRPGLWTVDFWPRRTGWHIISGNINEAIFVQDSLAWNTIKAQKKQRSTMWYSRELKNASSDPTGIERKIPSWILYVLFLVSSSFLWFEEKL